MKVPQNTCFFSSWKKVQTICYLQEYVTNISALNVCRHDNEVQLLHGSSSKYQERPGTTKMH